MFLKVTLSSGGMTRLHPDAIERYTPASEVAAAALPMAIPYRNAVRTVLHLRTGGTLYLKETAQDLDRCLDVVHVARRAADAHATIRARVGEPVALGAVAGGDV